MRTGEGRGGGQRRHRRGDFKRCDAACRSVENENPQAARAINSQVSTAVFANPRSDKEKGNRPEKEGGLMGPLLHSATTVAVSLPYPSVLYYVTYVRYVELS